LDANAKIFQLALEQEKERVDVLLKNAEFPGHAARRNLVWIMPN
jgi:hypothetical protein